VGRLGGPTHCIWNKRALELFLFFLFFGITLLVNVFKAVFLFLNVSTVDDFPVSDVSTADTVHRFQQHHFDKPLMVAKFNSKTPLQKRFPFLSRFVRILPSVFRK
jgi:hypothetical protein